MIDIQIFTSSQIYYKFVDVERFSKCVKESLSSMSAYPTLGLFCVNVKTLRDQPMYRYTVERYYNVIPSMDYCRTCCKYQKLRLSVLRYLDYGSLP